MSAGDAVLARARRAPAWLRNRVAQPAVVLCYHRVAALADDPFRLAVPPARFAEHLQAIRGCGRPVSLRDLARAARTGRWVRRGVVVTFDDGYADNLLEAKPLLERHDVPATVFVTSGAIGGDRGFWWDELERLVLGPHPLPATIALPVGEAERRWAVEPSVAAPPPAAAPSAAPPVGPHGRSPHGAARYALMRELHAALRPLPPTDVARAIATLHAALGVAPASRPSHRTCTADEVARLAEGGLIEVGAHTVTHPRLASLPPAEQRRELVDGRRTLERILGTTVTSVAYPFGGAGDATPATAALAREAGFTAACTLEPGVVWGRRPDLLQLPRLVVDPTMDGDALTRFLRWYALG